MAVRLKITLLFTAIMAFLLAVLCGCVYYFSYFSRLENIKAHLTNRALITSGMLHQPGVFNDKLMSKIDATLVRSIKNKSIQVYNDANEKLYGFSDTPADSLRVTEQILEQLKLKRDIFFSDRTREAIGYYDDAGDQSYLIFVSAFDEQGRKNLQSLTMILWLILTGGTLAAFILGHFFSRILLRPVRKIADEVNIISAQDLAHRIKSGSGDDEWHYLTDTLNNLLDRLQESFEIQRRFISSASHELSTPLTSISSQLEVSLQRERAAADQREVMQSVYQDVRQLGKLTQTLLEFATVSGTAGGIDIKLVRIDEVLMRLPGEISKMNKGYSVKFEFDQLPANEEKLLVFGNSDLLFTAIKNVVSNACKYSPDKLAKVRLSVGPGEIIIAIEDSGKGIAEHELKNIFQPFYRIDATPETVGFGVGLPLVKRIVKLHRGEIKVVSALGQGTTFFIHLPIATKPKNT